MLESLVNGESAKAEELFHEYVVGKSREIYESLIEAELDDEDVSESSDEDEDEDQVDENFEDIAVEGDDEFGSEDDGEFGDETGDLGQDLGMGDEQGEEPAERGEEELFQDLESIVDELQAKFDELKGIESDEHGDDFGDDEFGSDDQPEEGFDLETVREYVEKVPAGHGVEKKGGAEGQLAGTGAHSDKPSVNAKSIIDNMKNDMGGTTANILSSKEDAPVYAGAAGGKLKGTPLSDQSTKDLNSGNINVPGGKAGKTAFTHKEPGHGAEKKGQGEGKAVGAGTGANSVSGSTETQSLFRGRR